jgi:hypothetical protein
MRVPNAVHEARPWRIHDIVEGFTLLDVWALPVWGDPEDADAVRDLLAAFDPHDSPSFFARVLWSVRDVLGKWLDRPDDSLRIPGTSERSLIDRVPDDLRDSAADVTFERLPVVPLYRTDTEFAAEVSNKTVHGVLHLAWVEQTDGRYRVHMAVYVKTRGAFGRAYLALIMPFRYLVVYPALMRQIEAAWARREATLRS